MPFVSEKQRRKCWAMYNKDKKEGRKPKWDCREWESRAKKKTKVCGAKCEDGSKCRRKSAAEKCWQHQK